MECLILALGGLLTLNLRVVAGLANAWLSYPAAPVTDVLDFYETLSGKHVIYDDSIKGPVTIEAPNFITKEQAISLIEKDCPPKVLHW